MISDLDLVKKIQKDGCNESFLELKNRHAALCTNKLKPFWGLLVSMGYSEPQILHERDLAISRAIRTYSSGSAVATWIGNNVRWWFLSILKGFQKKGKETVLNDNKEFESHEKHGTDYDITDFVDRTLEDLGPKIKLVFQERYVLNKKVKDISRQHNIPKHQISQMNKAARNYLKSKIQETELAFPEVSAYN